ncbi:hypothetical protein Q5P01_020667 [Channa striata]|uniref:Uncharacterized protein n=1 Tax=Channa striata TaxID=64152 RepID=A0AA88LY30_CHASR|nr:hypothetical protein Q5P01_020667 [Channa striata]
MAEHKRASQGRAKESISGQRQSSERPINVHKREWSAVQQADAQKGRYTSRLTRQIDQEVVELSMQRITAVTTCDHRRSRRRGDREGESDGRSRRERG